ncbi:MAG: HAMP domain-containing histidine kinase [Alphaproteobacteria bacterium]|nr:HAMP domain-containing histidine kinase [Alphaproteobacteria bacterium]
MSPRRRFALGLTLTLLLTTSLAWLLARRLVLEPAAEGLEASRIDTVLLAAQRMQEGARMEQVEEELDIDLRMEGGDAEGPPAPPDGSEVPGPPPGDDRPGPPPAGGSGPPAWERWLPPHLLDAPGPPSARWTLVEHPRGRIWRGEGSNPELAAWTGDGWVVLHEHTFPLGAGLLALLLLGGLPVALVGYRLSTDSMQPVEQAERSLERIASGELDHRLTEGSGSKELQRMARAVNQMATRIERVVRGERQRMAHLSHELRTPLTRARLELDLARRAGVDVERLSRIGGEITQLERLVGELLELSRLELGGAELLRREQVDLRGLAEALVDDERHEAVQIEGEGEAWVDPRLARRALSNLLRNSHTHAPGARRWIQVQDGVMVVGDDGPGLPEAELAQALELFWRGPDPEAEGQGLGLAIVRQIVELHGGEVELRGDAGFVVTLRFPPEPASA